MWVRAPVSKVPPDGSVIEPRRNVEAGGVSAILRYSTLRFDIHDYSIQCSLLFVRVGATIIFPLADEL